MHDIPFLNKRPIFHDNNSWGHCRADIFTVETSKVQATTFNER